MRTRSPRLIAIRLVVLVGVVGWLVLIAPGDKPAPIPDAVAMTQATPTASTTSSSAIKLAEPAPNPIAHASSGYVHQANCKQALTGGNGDNDIGGWMADHPGWSWTWSTFYDRYRGDRFVQYVETYYQGKFQGGWAGYCMGDDSAIVDKFPDPPAGW